MKRETRIGIALGVYPILGAVYLVLLIALTSSAIGAAQGNPNAAVALTWLSFTVPAVQLLVAVFAVIALLGARRLAPGAPGRGRLVLASVAGLAHLVLTYATAVSLVGGGVMQEVLLTSDPAYIRSLFEELPEAFALALYVMAGVNALSLLVLLGSVISCWFLIERRIRLRIWMGIDVVLAVAFVGTTLTMPMFPDPDVPEQVAQASARLTATVLFVARVIAWVLPPLLDLVERSGFRPLVAARHLRAKKSGFLATISALSVMAVAFSSCSLTTTMSVMGGFRNDLKQKILGNNAHIVVDREHGNFEDWRPVLQRVRGVDDVEGATPIVSGEVMVTSASNLAGAVLRGIDPDSIGDVTDLPRNLRWGRLDYLKEPERLLHLSPSERGSASPSPAPLLPPPEGEEERSELSREIDRAIDQAIERAQQNPGAEGNPAALADAGSDREDAGPENAGDGAEDHGPADLGPGDLGGDHDNPLADFEQPEDEVLPGIIVGQELARTLRLYVGDEVNVVSPFGELGPSGPMPKSRPFRVAGIFYSGMYEYDMKHAYVSLETAQRFLNTDHAITRIEVKVATVEQAPATANAIRSAIHGSGLRVRDWQELNKNLFGALALEKLAMFVTLGIAIMVAGFCVFGTLTLMVQEKGREVGILKAMGTSKKSIVGVFMIEGLMIGIFGALIGLGLGFVMCFAAEHFGIRMDPQVYYIDKLPVHTDPVEFLMVGVAAAIVCLLATVFPAVLASELKPVDALRYD